MLFLSNLTYCVALPGSADWGVTNNKPVSSRLTLGGSTIHQTAQKSQTSATASYSRVILNTYAEIVRLLDESSDSIYLSDGSKVYEVVMDAKILESKVIGKKIVTIVFKIVSRLHPA
jgi:hypothetical protein